MLPIWSVWAAGAWWDSWQNTCQTIWYFFDAILRFGTAFWMIPVILTGKLLTNQMVYGEFIHLDLYLYSLRNLVKNLANYALAFLFIFKILTMVLDQKGDISSEIKKIIKWAIFAGVLIQISRWWMWVLLDISSLGIATVASLPSSLITNNIKYKQQFEETLVNSYGRSINTNNHSMQRLQTEINIQDATQDNTAYLFMNENLDKLMPTYENVSWPLMIMGMSMMRFMEWYKQPSTTINCTNIAMSTMFRAITLLFYLIPIIALLLMSIVRVFMLWIYITFSPFVALIYGLQMWWFESKSIMPQAVNWYLDSINIKIILFLIFQPILVVGCLSIGIVFLISMYSTLSLNEQSTYQFNGWSYITSKASVTQFAQNNQNEFYLEGSFLSENQLGTQSPVWYILMSIFTIGVLRSIVKITTSENIVWNKPLKSILDRWMNLIDKTVTSSAIVPIPGIGATSIASLGSVKNRLTDKFDSNTIESKINNYIRPKNENEAKRFAQMFGVTTDYDISHKDAQGIKSYREWKNAPWDNDRLHTIANKVFTDLGAKTKTAKITLDKSYYFTNAIKDRYTNGGAHYLQQIWVLDINEFKTTENQNPTLWDITSTLFDFDATNKNGSQQRLIQFIHTAIQDKDIWEKILKAQEKNKPIPTSYRTYPSSSGTTWFVTSWYNDALINKPIVTS